MGIVNVPDSSITREVDVTLPTYAGPEIGGLDQGVHRSAWRAGSLCHQLGPCATNTLRARRHASLIYCCQRRGFQFGARLRG